MRPVAEQTILITGSTDGLGRRTALNLARQGATVLLHGRNPEKGRAVLRELEEVSGSRTHRYYNADLSSLAEVRVFADEILRSRQELHVLINNAGIGARSRAARRELSKDGYELRFSVNYLSHYLLTHTLLPLLRRSAPGRIINVASVGQQPLDLEDVMLDHGYDDLRAYRQSKLAQIMFTFDLAAELGGTGVTVNSLHPASLMNTKMVFETSYFPAPLTSVEQGAAALEYLVTEPGLETVTGGFFNGKHQGRAHPQAYDAEARSRLRDLSDRLIGRARLAKTG